MTSIPDTNAILPRLQELANTGATPSELYAAAQNIVQEKGVLILKTPPVDSSGRMTLPDGTVTWFPMSDVYGIQAAQMLAPTSINLSIDSMYGQIILNQWITAGSLGGLGY